NVVPGLPYYGIAQGSIFAIYGTGLAPTTTALQSLPLQRTLNNVSIAVTVNGATANPLIYFLSPTQINAILPSNTPVGMGTITVTNGGSTSASMAIQVVQSAFGLLTYNGGGSGMVKAYDADNNNNLVGVTAAANPGDTLVLWGSGLGPVSGDESVTQTQTNMT